MSVLMSPGRRYEGGSLPGGKQTVAVQVGPDKPLPDCIAIGLVNNMPDAALESTERQFLDLLNAAASGLPVRLRCFSLPGVPRSEAAREYMSGRYSGIDELRNNRLDALIVTGTEPHAACLRDEPYWGSFCRLLAWAERNTTSTIWSCLAAHAAVLRMDRIERRRLDEKRVGLFECARVASHPLLTGVPDKIRIAHSRCNELRDEDLVACDYMILTRSPEAGIDAFIKQRKSLFLFFQGHPEYGQRALLREYRRDIGRFVRGQRKTYPAMPQGYFDPVAADALTRYQVRVTRNPHESVLDSFPSSVVENRLIPMAKSPAVRICANWLSYLHAHKRPRHYADLAQVHYIKRPARTESTGTPPASIG